MECNGGQRRISKPLRASQTPKSESQNEQLYNLVSRHGDFDKVMDGTFVYYITMGYNDPMLTKVSPKGLGKKINSSFSDPEYR
jgi:hypothetical protein